MLQSYENFVLRDDIHLNLVRVGGRLEAVSGWCEDGAVVA